MFMDMMQYQYVWHKVGSSVFNLEILMSKMHLALWSTNYWKSRWNHGKSWAKRYISSHDIGKELNIDHKTVLNHLEKARYKKKLRCLDAIWFNSEKFNRSNFICESLLKRNEIEFWNGSLRTMDDNNVQKKT